MAKSMPIHRDFKMAELGRTERAFARLNGWLDGALGIHCAIPGHNRTSRWRRAPATSRLALTSYGNTDGPRSPMRREDTHEPVWTPFVKERHIVAAATSSQMIAWLSNTNGALVQQIYSRAATVVRQHQEEGAPSVGAVGRFNHALTAWRSNLLTCRAAADAAVQHANLFVSCYWTALLRSHARQVDDPKLCQGLVPMQATLDPVWAKPDPFFLLRFGFEDDDASSKAARIFLLALELIGNPPLELDRERP